MPVLVQQGVDVNLCDKRNRTPLYVAISTLVPLHVVTRLISPQNINMQGSLNHLALSITMFLLREVDDLRYMQGRDGCTALHQVTMLERQDLVLVLVQKEAQCSVL